MDLKQKRQLSYNRTILRSLFVAQIHTAYKGIQFTFSNSSSTSNQSEFVTNEKPGFNFKPGSGEEEHWVLGTDSCHHGPACSLSSVP